MKINTLPTLTPSAVRATGERRDRAVHGVLLSAGQSTRFGEDNKLLAKFDGVPLVRLMATTLVESKVDNVTVVVGHEHDRVMATIQDLLVEFRFNGEDERGQSTSVREGVQAAQESDADGLLVALGDMPSVKVQSVDLLIESFEYDVSDALVAAYNGRRGNPVLFGRRWFEALADIDGDVGGRGLLTERNGAVAIETYVSGVLRDVNRPGDIA